MGKESELFKAVKQNDLGKVQQLLTSITNKKDKKKFWHSQGKVEGKILNINCRDTETLSTPLLLSVLYGSKDITKELINHNADVQVKDVKGNTVLHIAVFHNSLDLIDLLLTNNVEINDVNNDGNTALHIVCQGQVDVELGKEIVKKLLGCGADVRIQNKDRLTALDLAAMCNKLDVVKLFLHGLPVLRQNKRAIVEAAIRGHTSIVEVLLEYGVNSNVLDDISGTTALHEAVRFSRIDVVKMLLSFQANPDVQNVNRETPRILACDLPSSISPKMLQLIEDQPKLSPRIPTLLNIQELLESSGTKNIEFTSNLNYPVLPNDLTWTKNEPQYCSSCTEKNPNSHILDGNLLTFWVIPVLHNAWTIFDLHSEHIITGITVYGWKSPQMIKTFHLQSSLSIDGPWSNVTTQQCECLGSSDPKEPAFPQTFTGFTFCGRYLRLYIVDNHSGSYMCFQGIQFQGVDCQVLKALTQCGLKLMAENFISKGINTWKLFLNISQELVDELVSDSQSKTKLWKVIFEGRNKMYPMKTLSWLKQPPSYICAGETLPDISVQSEPGVSEEVQLCVTNGTVQGKTYIRMEPSSDNKPSVGTFKNISITSEGTFYLSVKGESSGVTLMSPNPIEVRFALRSENDITSAFQEIHKILNEVQATLPSKEH